MTPRWRAAIRKEALSFWRNPASRGMVLVSPIVQLVVFAFAATLDVRNVDIVILDQDNGRWSHELVARVGAASFVDELLEVQDPAEMDWKITHGEALLALHILPDFSRDIAAGRPGTVQVRVDGRKANEGQIAFSYLARLSSEMGAELSGRDIPPESRPRARVRHWFNPNLEFRWFIVPSIGATMALIIPLMMTSLSIARERELGTYEQLLVSPLTPLEIIITKMIPGIGAGMFIACVLAAIAIFAFGVPFKGNFLLYLIGILVFVLCVVGFGLTVSSFCQTQQQAFMISFTSVIPIMLTSGFMTPVDNMPGWLQVLAEANPLKHMLIIIQGNYLKSMTALEVWANVWPMLIIGTVTLGTATLVVRQRLQ